MTARLPSVGVWTGQFASLPAGDVRIAARGLEAMGYGALWYGEAFGREAIALGSLLLESTDRMVVASGVANIYVRDATAMVNGARSLAEASNGRFVLGIGVSHAPLVTGRGHRYERPYSDMVAYLDAMESVRSLGPEPPDEVPVVLAALGPRMLQLSADRTAGAHPYFTPVSHTAMARRIMGPDAILAPEQMVVLETDPVAARAVARRAMAPYLRMVNYRQMLEASGFEQSELDDLSDDVVDAIVAWGDVATCVSRVAAHLEAGADHVPVQVLTPQSDVFPVEAFATLAPALMELDR